MTEVTYDNKSINNAIVQSGMVTGLSDDLIAQVMKIAQLQQFKKGEYIVKEESDSRDLFIICEGEVSVRSLLPTIHLREEIIVKKGRNEILGEFSFADGQNRSASIRADKKIIVLLLDFNQLHEMMENNTEIGYRIMQNISRLISSRLRETQVLLRKYLLD